MNCRTPSIIILKPMALITKKGMEERSNLNCHPKRIIVNSRMINKIPRINKNEKVCADPFFLKYINAEMPVSQINIGAHKCVIQRVANNGMLVTAGSVGLNRNASE